VRAGLLDEPGHFENLSTQKDINLSTLPTATRRLCQPSPPTVLNCDTIL